MKLVREIDGHKFYSAIYETKEKAAENAKFNNTPIFVREEGGWMNGNFSGFSKSWQEDKHVSP